MAFKSVEEFKEERNQGKFVLEEDKDSAEVLFLYRTKRDELQADVHYIRTSAYTGYVHCCGTGCPACARKFRRDSKIFIPLYVMTQTDRAHGGERRVIDQILFWDKKTTFDKQLDQDVFYNYATPIDYVFKITRNGAYKDMNTRYEIKAIGTNTGLTYDSVLAKFQAKMPDYYSNVVKEFTATELENMLRDSAATPASDLPEYTPVPRAGYQSSLPNTYVNVTDAVNPSSADAPEIPEIGTMPASDVADDEFPDPDF